MTQSELHTAVLHTLAYASIFQYPLTFDELYLRLIASKPYPHSRQKFFQQITKIPHLKMSQKFVHLWSEKNSVKTRKLRAKWSAHLWPEAERIKNICQRIPTVEAVYITGSLAMNNVASKHDDVDVLIITKPYTLWSTRLLLILITAFLGKYRLHGSRGGGWCFNLWLTTHSLTVEPERRNLYTAYEIIQAKQILGNENILLLANPWVRNFLPHTILPKSVKKKKAISSLLQILSTVIAVFDKICFNLQYMYMYRRITREKVNRQSAFFHPRDTHGWIFSQFEQKIKSL